MAKLQTKLDIYSFTFYSPKVGIHKEVQVIDSK